MNNGAAIKKALPRPDVRKKMIEQAKHLGGSGNEDGEDLGPGSAGLKHQFVQSFVSHNFSIVDVTAVLIFFIAGLLYLLRFKQGLTPQIIVDFHPSVGTRDYELYGDSALKNAAKGALR